MNILSAALMFCVRIILPRGVVRLMASRSRMMKKATRKVQNLRRPERKPAVNVYTPNPPPFDEKVKPTTRSTYHTSCKPNPLPFNDKVKPPTRSTRNEFYKSWEWKQARYEALQKHGRRCQCCGWKPGDTATGRLVVDHIKPRSHFPHLELDLSNLQVLCDGCNRGKSNIHTDDFRTVGRGTATNNSQRQRADGPSGWRTEPVKI